VKKLPIPADVKTDRILLVIHDIPESVVVNCPKCGFEQEEREDCGKCGVVIAKYLALHTPESAAYSENQASSYSPIMSPNETGYPTMVDITEMQNALCNLQQRFNELEFERAERRKFRGEFRSLEEKVKEALKQLSVGNEKIRLRVAGFESSPEFKELRKLGEMLQSIDLESVVQRLAVVEARLHTSAQEERPAADPQMIALLQKLDGRLSEMERRLTANEKKGAARTREHPQMESVRKEIEELKTSLQNVSIRYTEIGDLKKNHLVLRNMLESFQAESERFRKETTLGGSERLAEMEKEVHTLRAEMRKAYERMELLESWNGSDQCDPAASQKSDVVSLHAQLNKIERLAEENRRRTDSEISNLEVRFSKNLSLLDSLPETLEAFSAQIRHMEQQNQQLAETLEVARPTDNGSSQNVESLNSEITDLREEMQEAQSGVQNPRNQSSDEAPEHNQTDIVVIRESLAEIRQFMAALSHRL
jgi:transcription initiation factor TFIIIB Brf1 subunit/transcription initiation factor TFIIB